VPLGLLSVYFITAQGLAGIPFVYSHCQVKHTALEYLLNVILN
jgi:hypothetical protein